TFALGRLIPDQIREPLLVAGAAETKHVRPPRSHESRREDHGAACGGQIGSRLHALPGPICTHLVDEMLLAGGMEGPDDALAPALAATIPVAVSLSEIQAHDPPERLVQVDFGADEGPVPGRPDSAPPLRTAKQRQLGQCERAGASD